MPSFFIVGAARAGTTSLHRYLSQHPEIFITWMKEVHFFASDYFPGWTGPGDEWLNRRLIRDEDEYVQLFAGVTGEKAIGEASVYYLFFPGTAERIAQSVPDAKIIMLLREPVDRAYSSYMLLVRDGREHLGFAEGLKQEEERKQKGFEPIWWYKELGLYYNQVKHYLDVFGTQQVKVLLYDEFYANPGPILRDIFAFLGVKEDAAIDTSMRHNSAGVPTSRKLYKVLSNFIGNHGPLIKRLKPLVPLRVRDIAAQKALATLMRRVPMDPQIREELQAYFAEDVGKLEDLLHRNLYSWQYRVPSLVQEQ